MSDQPDRIRNLRENGASWAELFRQIIASFPEGQDQRMLLFRELRDAYGFDVATLLELGAWNYWEENGISDEQVNQLLDERNPQRPTLPDPARQGL